MTLSRRSLFASLVAAPIAAAVAKVRPKVMFGFYKSVKIHVSDYASTLPSTERVTLDHMAEARRKLAEHLQQKHDERMAKWVEFYSGESWS